MQRVSSMVACFIVGAPFDYRFLNPLNVFQTLRCFASSVLWLLDHRPQFASSVQRHGLRLGPGAETDPRGRVTDELDTRRVKRLGYVVQGIAVLRGVTGGRATCFPIADGIPMDVGRAGKPLTRPAKEGAAGSDLCSRHQRHRFQSSPRCKSVCANCTACPFIPRIRIPSAMNSMPARSSAASMAARLSDRIARRPVS